MVEMKPWAEAAVPAIWPIGSMAMEPKLPAMKPKQNILQACKTANIHRLSWPIQAMTACSRLKPMKPNRAVWAIRRVPSLSTRREFNTEARAMPPATMAKTVVNRPGDLKTSKKICCDELMKANRAPLIAVMARV
ncbi:hypothetical protein D3C80_1192730 [compost metagenome]